MTRLEDVLRQAARRAPLVGEGPPEIEPEALAELHAGQVPPSLDVSTRADLDTATWRDLFAAEALPGEEAWAPSPRVLATLAAQVGGPAPLRLALRWMGQALEVLQHTGELLSPRPLAVRSSAQAAVPTRTPPSHTFRHVMPPFEVAVGLQPEGAGRFGLTLTVEAADAPEPAIRLTLWEGSRRRAVRSGDGAVFLAGLRSGSYRLEVVAAGQALGDIEVEVSDGDPGD